MKNLVTASLLLLLALLLPLTASAYDFKEDGIYYDINGEEATVVYMAVITRATLAMSSFRHRSLTTVSPTLSPPSAIMHLNKAMA